jgi:hypothetical protein
MESTELFTTSEPTLKIVCPKHGTHDQYINSTVKGHEGNWCMLCWLESLGDPLPTIEE